ncbi:hypothetical protein [Porphyromonas gulae]|nr:hypothetical protein [Porphyromonas gulae]
MEEAGRKAGVILRSDTDFTQQDRKMRKGERKRETKRKAKRFLDRERK